MENQTDWDKYLSTRRTAAYTDRELVRRHLKGRMLDVGCGFGDFAAECFAELGLAVAGVDPSAEAISEARQLCPQGAFEVGVAEDLPFADSSFDSLICIEVVEHLKEPERFFAEAYRVLRSGGSLVVQTPNYPVKRLYDFLYRIMGRKKTFADDPTHVSPFTFRRMRRLAVGAGFAVVSISGRNILGEMKMPFLKRLKAGRLARLFVQKMILVAKKP